MSNKNKQNAQSSAVNKEAEQADNKMNDTEARLLKKQQELKEIEASLKQKETAILQKEKDLKIDKEAITKKEVELKDKHIQLEDMELQAKNGFPKLFEEKFAAFKKQREAEYVNELASLEDKKEKLRQRELTIQKAEIERNKGYTDERSKLDDELFNRRQKLEKEMESKRSKEMASIEKEMADVRKAHEESIQNEKDELEEKRKVFLNNQAELDELKDELEYQKQRLQSRKDALEEREANLNVEVETKVVEKEQSFENKKSALNDEIARLREEIKTSSALIFNFEDLKHKLGNEDPAAVLLKLKTYEEEIKKMREDLATRPTQDMQETFDRLKSENMSLEQACNSLSEQNMNLKKNAQEQSQLEMQISELEAGNKSYKDRFELVDADNNRLLETLKRFQASYEREQDREARIKDIETPYVQEEQNRCIELKEEASKFMKLQGKRAKLQKSGENLPKDDLEEMDELDKVIGQYELQWLSSISKSCTDYGLRFPRRILHAFHTALKTSEWSPMTVLAGVSGTGKSELPRLYSHFGGINFLSLSVQPNWDSQESMLGFFNSIDNKFDAQPVLRLLAQSQKKVQAEDYPFGLEDVMSLILMDEMNLAHVELYFAEFLSKLEMRRGLKGNEVPCLEVKLGAGIQQYDLPLGRNVLWAGTMNQDETTKSLSDKVLDRGIVINFPRPTTLERRCQLKSLGEHAPLLSRKLWESWWCRESKFEDDQILPYKGFVEEMNKSLSNVGRALGHRVWQSIEYYMSNYPDVLEAQRNNDDTKLGKAMKIAFEDQLVQKVMPKLRGIETRGKSKSDCLDKIRTQLVNHNYTIIDDFDLACEFGYGQFIWNSANYITDDEIVNDQENEERVESNNDTQKKERSSADKTNHQSDEQVKEQLVSLAKSLSKDIWKLTTLEIRESMNCSAKEAKQFKMICNEMKETK